jgi:tetratricopeptide (TPR) repeat protein
LKFTRNIFLFPFILSFLITVNLSCKSTKKVSKSTSKGISEQDETKFTYYYIDGCKERMKGNIEIAENLFKQCLKIDPTSSAVKYELGNIYKYNGLYDTALKYAKECANSEQKNEWYQLLYIECLHFKRQYPLAADIYSRLIKNFPNRSEFYEGLAAEQMYSGNYEKSYKTFDELEKKFGVNEAFTINKIKLLKQLKKYNEAEDELKKLIHSDSTNATFYLYLGDFYREINQNEKALVTYKAILTFDKNNTVVHLSLADYYKSQNDDVNFYNEVKLAFENPDVEADTKAKILKSYYEITDRVDTYLTQAYELCELALKTNPSSSELHNVYGEFLLRDKKISEARSQFEHACALDKSNYSVWNQLMIVESELGDYKSLESHSFEAMDLFPNLPLPYFFNGLANTTLKNYTKAVQSLEDGIEFVYDNKPLLIEFFSTLGNAYNYLKDFQKSDKAYEDALKVDPDNASILNNYGYYLSLRKDKLEKAEKFSKRSNELAPNNRAFIDTYGWILYQLGKYRESEAWLSRSAKMGDKSAVLLEHYGDVLYKLDKKEDALNMWKEAKKVGGGSEFLDKKISEKQLNE